MLSFCFRNEYVSLHYVPNIAKKVRNEYMKLNLLSLKALFYLWVHSVLLMVIMPERPLWNKSVLWE